MWCIVWVDISDSTQLGFFRSCSPIYYIEKVDNFYLKTRKLFESSHANVSWHPIILVMCMGYRIIASSTSIRTLFSNKEVKLKGSWWGAWHTMWHLWLSSYSYGVFHRLGQAKFVNGVTILSPSQFSLLPQLPHKTKLESKLVKADSKIIILLPKI